MPRPSVLHALTGAGLAVVVAAPLAVTTGALPAFAASERSRPAPQSQQAEDAAVTAARLVRQRQLSQEAVARAAAARAAAEKAAADKAAADALAARAAEAERASRAQRNADPRRIARSMLAERGQGEQFGCLDRLWTKESEWRVDADNPTSSAYGIPQALPGKKMATAGADWKTNPATQIRWGLGYIAEVYGGPCAAWKHSQARNWY